MFYFSCERFSPSGIVLIFSSYSLEENVEYKGEKVNYKIGVLAKRGAKICLEKR